MYRDASCIVWPSKSFFPTRCWHLVFSSSARPSLSTPLLYFWHGRASRLCQLHKSLRSNHTHYLQARRTVSPVLPYRGHVDVSPLSIQTIPVIQCRVANCNANPGFKPLASGGDGSSTQFWFVGYDPTTTEIIVSHEGTDASKMYTHRDRSISGIMTKPAD